MHFGHGQIAPNFTSPQFRHNAQVMNYAVGVKAPRVAGTFDVSVYLGDALVGLGQLTVE